MKKLLVFLLSLTFFACSDPEKVEKDIRRIVQEKILSGMNMNTKTIELVKEADDQFLVKVELENGEKMELIFKGNEEKHSISETENSRAMRMIGSSMGVGFESLSLKPIDSVTFNGSAVLNTGEKIQFFYDKNLGFYATDQASLGIVTRHQIAQSIGMPCRGLSLEKTNEEMLFRGEAQIETGQKLLVFVHQQRGWYPANEQNTLMLLTRLQLEAQQYKVDSLYVQKSDSNLYIGKVQVSQPSKKEFSLNIRHKGTSFEWGIGE